MVTIDYWFCPSEYDVFGNDTDDNDKDDLQWVRDQTKRRRLEQTESDEG